jgi:Big-like domain-containing protein/lactonase family protein with 7-bladed beta-propeller
VLPLLSLLGLSACVPSTFSNLFVTDVDITPANPSIATAGTQQFTLSVTFVDGKTDHENPNHTTWTSDNTAVATIDKSGIATGVSVGTATIGGSFQGNNAHTVLTVTNLNPGIAVRGDSRTLHVTKLATGQELTFAANSLSDAITVSSGSESESAAGFEFSVFPEHGPAWLAVHPSGNFLYVVNHTSESISAFAIDWKSGALNPVASSPFRAGAKAWSVAVDPGGAGLSVTHFGTSEISRFRIDRATGALTSEQQ